MRAARALALILACAANAAAQGGTLVGRVVTRDGGDPLPFGVIELPDLGREQFADDSGAFRLSGLKEGALRLRVRRLGYRPFEATMPVRANATDTVVVALDRIAVRLASVDVREHPPCLTPGAPSLQRDSTLAAVYEQLQLNAQQLRILSEKHPFAYAMRQRLWSTTRDGRKVEEGSYLQPMSSQATWRYRPGQVVAYARSGRQRARQLEFRLPTLVELAEPAFIANHCFHYAGTVPGEEGDQLVQVDIVAAEALREPDVHGSMFLDATTFQIRRYVMRLSRMPRSGMVRGMTGLEVQVRFTEVLPGIPVVEFVSSTQRFDPSARGVELLAAHEEQAIVSFRFLKSRPGETGRQ